MTIAVDLGRKATKQTNTWNANQSYLQSTIFWFFFSCILLNKSCYVPAGISHGIPSKTTTKLKTCCLLQFLLFIFVANGQQTCVFSRGNMKATMACVNGYMISLVI